MSITVVCKLVGSCLSAHRAVHLWYGYSCIMHRAHVMGGHALAAAPFVSEAASPPSSHLSLTSLLLHFF